MTGKPIILFDGICNFCNGAVNFVIQRDKKSRLKFGAIQSKAGRQLLKQFNLSLNTFHSFILIEDGIVYTQSTAALRVCKYLSAWWPLLYGLIIVPEFIRDGVYRWIAKNRYKWFGKQEQCMIPTTKIRHRFLQ